MAICALVGASDFNEEAFRRLHAAGAYASIVAVDGGFAHLAALGIVPDAAVGDFDSLGYVPEGLPVDAVSPVGKAESDMEMGFRWARSQGWRRIHAFGALGGRLDHTVANLHLFARMSEEGIDVSAIDEDCAVTLLTGPRALELPSVEKGTVSVFSLSDEADGVVEEGLMYSFDTPRLGNRSTRGLSNELIGCPARIAVESGTLAVFHPIATLAV